MKAKMNLKKKILPITLGLAISVGGSVSIANAMINNDNITPVAVKANNVPLLNDNVKLMSQQHNKEIEIYKDMVNNMTPEQMLEMDKAWMEQHQPKQNHQPVQQPQKNTKNINNNKYQNIKQHHNNSYRGNHNREMNNTGWNNRKW